MREEILAVAKRELGYKEEPINSNMTKYGAWYKLNGMAWCGMFVSWCFDQAGDTLPTINNPKGFSGCQHAFNYFTKKNQITKTPKPGDIVLFDWNGDNRYDHTGIFEKDNNDGGISFTSIEGNTALGNDSHGGEVMRRTKRKYAQSVFVDVTSYLKTT